MAIDARSRRQRTHRAPAPSIDRQDSSASPQTLQKGGVWRGMESQHPRQTADSSGAARGWPHPAHAGAKTMARSPSTAACSGRGGIALSVTRVSDGIVQACADSAQHNSGRGVPQTEIGNPWVGDARVTQFAHCRGGRDLRESAIAPVSATWLTCCLLSARRSLRSARRRPTSARGSRTPASVE